MDLEKMLKEAQEKRNALYESIKAITTNEELDKVELDIRKVDMEIKTLEEKIQANKKEEPAARKEIGEPNKRQLNPLETYKRSQKDLENRNNEEGDIYSSLEYRQAFRNYVVNGTPIPEQFSPEQRADELTLVGNVAAVIPTNILNKVIEDMTVEGKIITRVTQTQFQGGVEIPISEINPTATWISESTVSGEQKGKMEAKISFSYHILEAKIAIGIVASTVSLPVFEANIVKNLKKAMIRAIEAAIVTGTGSGQPLGFTKYNLPTSQIVNMTSTEMGTVKGWAKAEAAIDEAHDGDPLVYMMNKTTWDMYVNSMVDSTGQKIGLGRIDEKGRKVLNGREVFITDRLPGMDAAAEGDIVAVLVNLEEYIINSNLAMYYKKYFDEDTNKWKHKALMIADGKMAIGTDSTSKLVGAGGLIYIKKDIVV